MPIFRGSDGPETSLANQDAVGTLSLEVPKEVKPPLWSKLPERPALEYRSGSLYTQEHFLSPSFRF